MLQRHEREDWEQALRMPGDDQDLRRQRGRVDRGGGKRPGQRPRPRPPQGPDEILPQISEMHLVDFNVRIVEGSEGTAARVKVLLDSQDGDELWSTIDVSENIIEASWQAPGGKHPVQAEQGQSQRERPAAAGGLKSGAVVFLIGGVLSGPSHPRGIPGQDARESPRSAR